MKDLVGRSAVVTGAATGMGRAIALSLAQEGVNVAVADIDVDLAEATAEAAREFAVETIAVQTDVSQRSAVENLADKAYDAFGSVEILVNNAGVTWRPFRSIWDASQKDFEWIMSVNWWGVFYGFHVFIPRMIETPGEKHIVSTSSGSSFGALAGHSAYSAAKAAVDQLSRVAQAELEHLNIGVSVLFPGKVGTRIPTSERLRPEGDRAENRDVKDWQSYGLGGAGSPRVTVAMDPSEVGPMVVQAIKDNEFYILTHSAQEEVIQERANSIIRAGRLREPHPSPQRA